VPLAVSFSHALHRQFSFELWTKSWTCSDGTFWEDLTKDWKSRIQEDTASVLAGASKLFQVIKTRYIIWQRTARWNRSNLAWHAPMLLQTCWRSFDNNSWSQNQRSTRISHTKVVTSTSCQALSRTLQIYAEEAVFCGSHRTQTFRARKIKKYNRCIGVPR